MKKSSEELKVYADFFTNDAVAWFSAGVIAPLFTSNTSIRSSFASAASILASFAFLQIAVMLKKEI